MAHSKINLENDGLVKVAPIGFSWTVFFFNGLPPLIRGHIVIGVIMFITGIITYGIVGVIMAFFYNKIYLNYLLDKGYRFQDVLSGKSKEEIEKSLGMELNSRS